MFSRKLWLRFPRLVACFRPLSSNCEFLVEKFCGRKYKRQIKKTIQQLCAGSCVFVCTSSRKSKYLCALLYEAVIRWGRSWCGVFEWIDAGAVCVNGAIPNKPDNKQNPPFILVVYLLFIPTSIIFICYSKQGPLEILKI